MCAVLESESMHSFSCEIQRRRKLVRQIIDMLPYVSFKIEPSENKVLHRGFFTHKAPWSGVCECAPVCACASVQAGFRDLTSKEFRHMVANTYTQRETDRERAKEGLREMQGGRT